MKNIFYFFVLMIIVDNAVNAQVQVTTGWNLIGAITTIQASEVTTDPPGIIVSPFYGYNTGSGYYAASTLEAAKGFWIKVSSNGTIYGFEPLFVCGMSKVNYEYKYYSTVQIGTQCWLKENLDLGIMIPVSQNAFDNGIIEKYCYGDNETNCQLFGGLYQWNEAMQYVTTPGTQGICPPGWHMPTLAEFQVLSTAVGGDGNALKAVGQAGTNTSGFSALLAGHRVHSGYFWDLGYATYFWSSTEFDVSLAYYLGLHGVNNGIYLANLEKERGFSVRCIKD